YYIERGSSVGVNVPYRIIISEVIRRPLWKLLRKRVRREPTPRSFKKRLAVHICTVLLHIAQDFLFFDVPIRRTYFYNAIQIVDFKVFPLAQRGNFCLVTKFCKRIARLDILFPLFLFL